MGINKNKVHMLNLIGFALSSALDNNTIREVDELTEEQKKAIIKKELEHRKLKEIENKKRKGLTLYTIKGIEVWALNEKSANKKVAKIITSKQTDK